MTRHYECINEDTLVTLKRECYFLYRLMFSKDPSHYVFTHYVNAHKALAFEIDASDAEIKSVANIVEKKINALAVESCLRRKGKSHLLSTKIAFISYISECSGEISVYKARQRNLLHTFISLTMSVCLGLLNRIYGTYLVHRHGIL